jgi:tetratricopeptide (TPR) repeat protein
VRARPRDDLALLPSPPPVPLPPITTAPAGLRSELDAVPCALERLDGSISDVIDREGTTGDVLYLLGARRQITADFASAADYYEAFALHTPEADGESCSNDERVAGICADAPRALERAIAFRHALGETERAVELAERYVETYGETRVADAARVSLEAGRFLREADDAGAAVRHYRTHTQRFARHVRAAESVEAWVARGRAEWDAGERQSAARSFRRALRAWRRGSAEDVAVAADGDGDAAGVEFARALDAVAEAGFHLAELRYERFREIAAPEYDGEGTPRDVERWVERRLRPWVIRKARALTDARLAFARVAELGSSRFRVAAEARTGEMYHEMLDAFRHAPLPEIRFSTERETLIARADWRDGPIERLRVEARDAFRRCLDVAIRSRQLGRDAARCASELDRIVTQPSNRELFRVGVRVRETIAEPRPIPAARPERSRNACTG